MGGTSSKGIEKEHLKLITHSTSYTKDEVIKLYKSFALEHPNGCITKKRFLKGNCRNASQRPFWTYIFSVMDIDGDGEIDFAEYCETLCIAQKGTTLEKLQWAFSVYDMNNNNTIEVDELLVIVKHLYAMLGAKRISKMPENQRTAEQRVKGLLEIMDPDDRGRISLKMFINGCYKDNFLISALELYKKR